MRFTLASAALLPLISAIVVNKQSDAGSNIRHILDGSKTIKAHESGIKLRDIDADGFTTLVHRDTPNHKVKIKSTDGWCDTVKSYSGYIDTGYGKDLWFYFFESRSDPSTDPIVMWINGGPGCSSALGAFMELGPCHPRNDSKTLNDTVPNPHSWNSNANVFFLDQPIGVGFSHAENGQTVSTTEQAAIDVKAFVRIFFDTFKEFKGRDFHMAGESYGGRYLPVFAGAVYDDQANNGVDLKSVLIGNGLTDNQSYYPYLCKIQPGLNSTVFPIDDCWKMAKAVPKCHNWYTKWCMDEYDVDKCGLALDYCGTWLGNVFSSVTLNPYDVTKDCSSEALQESLCYLESDWVDKYLNLPDVRQFLGIDSSVKKFSGCNYKVNSDFSNANDDVAQTYRYVTELVERGVRVLSYTGTNDYICNHIANEAWTNALEWTYHDEYYKTPFSDWNVDGKKAGIFKTYGALSHLKVYGAGHMVPFDKPAEALAMFNAWINDKPFERTTIVVKRIVDK